MIECKNIVITHTDRQRLGSLLEKAAQDGWGEPRSLDDLLTELERALSVDSCDVPADVVTMNSTVQLRDLETGETFEYTLVYPPDADVNEDRISVLAPVGMAILGAKKGDVVEWPVPAGTLRVRVEEILYQPERSGEFDR